MLLTRSLAPLNRRDSGVAARSPPGRVIGPGARDSQPRAARRDRYWWRIRTQPGLEVASGSRLRSCAACLLLSGALRSAEIRSLKYHGESVPDGLLLALAEFIEREKNSAGERTGGTASRSCRRCASPETMHCAPATRASATR